MTTTTPATDYKVADIGLAEFGRKEIELAEHEMPGLMALREEFGEAQPLEGRPHHRLAAHDDPDRGADRDARRRSGPRCAGARATSSPPRTTPPPRSPPAGIPVFAWKGETLEEYWWCTEQALTWDEGGPNMILDDGGDATLLVHKGAEYERAGAVPDPADGRRTRSSRSSSASCSARSRPTRSAGRASPPASRA